ncbi:hypothetical protein CI41S_48480 [Bradyrhizobium ivorense]|nr:hypothetical protein CI41S_48480 [Bradyrhizobium ivorense]
MTRLRIAHRLAVRVRQRQPVLVNDLLLQRRRVVDRNVVLDRDYRAVVELHEVAVGIGHHERLGDIQRHALVIVVAGRIDRQVIDLVLQREREVARAVINQREHNTAAGDAVDLGRAHHMPGHRRALRENARRRAFDARRKTELHRARLVRADVHQRQDLRRRVGRRNSGMASFGVAHRLVVRVRERQPVLVHHLLRQRRRVVDRNVVLDRNHGAVVELHEVAVRIGHNERLGDVQRHALVIVVARRIDRQVIDLVLQREREVARAVIDQGEHHACTDHAVDLGRAHHMPGHRRALREDARRRALDRLRRTRKRHRARLVRTDVDQRQDLRGRIGRRDGGMTRLRVANRLAVRVRKREPVLKHRLLLQRRRVVDRNIVLDRNHGAVVELHEVTVEIRHHECLGDVDGHAGIIVAARRVDRQVIDLILQREGEVARAVIDQGEHHAPAGHAVDLGRAHHVPGHRGTLREDARRRALDTSRTGQLHRAGLVRADIDQRQNLGSRIGRGHSGVTGLRVAHRLVVGVRQRQAVLEYLPGFQLVRVVDRNVVLDRDHGAVVQLHGVVVRVRHDERLGDVDGHALVVVIARRVDRQMIDLVLQREGEVAKTVIDQREHHARTDHAVDLGPTHHVPGHRRALREDAGRRAVDPGAGELHRAGLVRADRHQR